MARLSSATAVAPRLSARCPPTALSHGRAQQDTCGTVHLGAVVIPMLTSLIEVRKYPMDRFLPALLAGCEVAGFLDRASGATTAPMELRDSILFGTIGAAAAGYLMGLDEDRMAAALANAVAFTGGTLQSFNDGTDEWRYQVAIANAVDRPIKIHPAASGFDVGSGYGESSAIRLAPIDVKPSPIAHAALTMGLPSFSLRRPSISLSRSRPTR